MAFISLFLGGIWNKTPEKESYTVDGMLKSIKAGRWQKQVERLRKITDKDKFKKEKDKLDYITWSGTFAYCMDKDLIAHSGFICIDFDDIDNLADALKLLREDPYTYGLFISPSGAGIKVLVQIAPDKHRPSYLWLEKYYKEKYNLKTDEKCKNESRACYISYDPDTLIKETSEIAPSITAPTMYRIGTSTVEATGDFTKLLERARKWANKTSGEYGPSNHNQHAYVFACQANRLGIPEDHTLQYSLSEFIEINEKELTASINSAYKHHTDEHGKIKPTAQRSNTGRTTVPAAATRPATDQIADGTNSVSEVICDTDKVRIEKGKFWQTIYKKKDEQVIVAIDYESLIEFLEENGFMRQSIANNGIPDSYQLIRMQNNILEPIDRFVIKTFIRQWMQQNNVDRRVRQAIMKGSKNYFSKETLEYLKPTDVVFKRDTREEAFLYFKNSYIRVTADKITTHSYTELEAPIWKHKINSRDFNYKQNYYDSEFYRFLSLAVAGKEEFTDSDDDKLAIKNLIAVCNDIGYLLHEFKDPSKAYSSDYFDAVIKSRKSADGRTGKSLLFKLLNYVKPVVMIECRSSDLNRPETFSQVNYHTAIVCFNDVPSEFPFDRIFPYITESWTIKRLYTDPFTIDFKHAPKVAITSNHTLKGKGGSYSGRQKNFEFSDYFNPNFSPADYFKHNLGEDWTDEQWDLFYSTAIHCIQSYLQDGLTAFEGKYEFNKLLNEIPEEFYMYCESLKLDTDYIKSDMIIVLQEKFDFKLLSPNSFTLWLKDYCDFKKYVINPHIIPIKKGHFPRDKRGTVEHIRIVDGKTVVKKAEMFS